MNKQLAHVYTIEFQKRGLHHPHILIILSDHDKPREPCEYDRIVCVKLPDPIFQPQLQDIIKRCMIHGPVV